MRGEAGFPVRLRFTKRGKVRWISHRDVARALERAFRVVELPLAFTEGFSPRPKVSLGLALSVGYESDAEYLDVRLTRTVDPEALVSPLSEALPAGIDITGAVALRDRAPALQEAVTAVTWRLRIEGTGHEPAPDHVVDVFAAARQLPSLPTTRRRKGREVVEDVRPPLRRLDLVDGDGPGVPVELEVDTQPRSPKPDEIVAAVAAAVPAAGGLRAAGVLRTHQWIERDGARQEPLAADLRPRAPEARAS